jgi:probable HAF family extracellular repeat protein/VCBS repeat-containing protein
MATTPIIINNISDLLQAIQNNPSGYYVLGANIDASGFNFTSIAHFSGVLDGQGHSIDNLQTTLFSTIDAQGRVANLNLTNVHVVNAALALENDGAILNLSVTGTVTGGGNGSLFGALGNNCGALVVYNLGSISESYSQAMVHGVDVGGLVGFNGTTGIISNSYATGSVTGNSTFFQLAGDGGGLVDTNVGLITGSYATGAVSGFFQSGGGLVGNNGVGASGVEGTISNCYATGSVSGAIVGGLAGRNNANITDSYAIGLITETDDRFLPGGLVGYSFQGNVTNSYWDVETSGTSYSVGGTVLTTAQLESGILPTGFDPTIWLDITGQFPELRWQVGNSSLTTYTYTTIDELGLGRQTYLYGINNSGQVVGWYLDPVTYVHVLVYDITGATYTTLDNPLGRNGTDGYGINDVGQIVGHFADGTYNHAFLYSGGAWTTLPGGIAWGINNAGQIVGDGGLRGYVYNNGSLTDIFYPQSNLTSAHGINTNGEVVGYYQDGTGYHGFTDIAGIYSTFDDPLGPGETFATGVNDGGQIVGYYYDTNGLAHGFLDTGGNFTTIDDKLGTGGTFAEGINNAGEIVGYYIDSSGVNHGFLATLSITPPPDQPPVIDLAHSTVTGIVNERLSLTGSSLLDFANGASATIPSGVIAFTDPDTADRPTASIDTADQTITYKGAGGQPYSLTSAQIAAFEAAFSIAPEAGNTNTGKIDWTYSIVDKSLDFLGVGEHITVTTPIVIDDHNGGTVTQNVVVTINGADDKPIPVPDSAVAQKGATITADAAHGLLVNDTDPDIHDILHVSAIRFGSQMVAVAPGHAGSIQGANGLLTVNSDGSYTYAARQNAAPNVHDQFTYTVDDGHSAHATSFLNVTITNPQNTNPYSPIVEIGVHFQNDPVVKGQPELHMGTGVLIGPNEILTAAHLFEAAPGQELGPVTEIIVMTGSEALAGQGALYEFETQNISTTLGNNVSVNRGPGPAAQIDGYDPYWHGISADPSHDLAVLGISSSTPIGNTLGWLTPIPNAPDGTYTLAGFPQPLIDLGIISGSLVTSTGLATFSSLVPKNQAGLWSDQLHAESGMSGGPLLSDQSHIVGIQSGIDPVSGSSIQDRITPTQLTDITHWMQLHGFLL